MNDRNSFWNESTGERLIGCLGGSIGILSLLCVVSVIVHHCNRPVPTTTAAPWLNDDLSRPVTDIKELDYNRRLIIYRDEEPRRQLQKFEYPKDEQYMVSLKTYTKTTTKRYMNIFTIKNS